MEILNTALSLMLVGMITVFIILSLVVVIGNLVIRLTNRFIPEAPLAAGKSTVGNAGANKLSSKKLAAVVAAVDVLTHGKGSITSIEKKSNK